MTSQNPPTQQIEYRALSAISVQQYETICSNAIVGLNTKCVCIYTYIVDAQ